MNSSHVKWLSNQSWSSRWCFFFLPFFFRGRINKTCLRTLRWPLFLSHSLFFTLSFRVFSPSWHGCVVSGSRTCVMLQPQGPRRVCLLWLKVNFSSTILQKLQVAVTYSQATCFVFFFKTKICISVCQCCTVNKQYGWRESVVQADPTRCVISPSCSPRGLRAAASQAFLLHGWTAMSRQCRSTGLHLLISSCQLVYGQLGPNRCWRSGSVLYYHLKNSR